MRDSLLDVVTVDDTEKVTLCVKSEATFIAGPELLDLSYAFRILPGTEGLSFAATFVTSITWS